MNVPYKVLSTLGAALFIFSAPLCAQTYPAKTIRYMVGYPPGGGTDILARIVAQKLSETFGQQVVVDNRPGANSNIAAEISAKAAPDGYNIFMVSAGLAINKALDSSLKFDLERDFTPIIAIADVPMVVAVHPSVPATSIKQLIALAKAKPEQLSYGSSGNGSSEQITAELLSTMTKIKLWHVQYKGGNAAAVAAAGGQVALSFNSVPAALPFLQNGRLKILAVTSERRTAVLPDVPTVAESGVPGYAYSVWYGTLAPAGTPKDVVSRLNSEINKIIKLRDVTERFATLGADATGGTAEAFGARIKSEVAKFTRIIKESNIQPE